jgi:hypothetical protein
MAEAYLKKIYTNPKHPGSFSGPEKLYPAVKKEGKFIIGRARIRKWLQGNSTYTFNRDVHRKFRRNEVVVAGYDNIWDCDLFNMSSYSKENKGYRHVLLMIDIFSRYAWLRPLKSKYGTEVVSAIKSIFKEGRKPELVRSDKGRDMTNNILEKFYKSENIHHYCTHNDTQANYAERCIKTIKTKIFRYMKYNNTHRYIDQLQNIVTGYNSSVHSSLGIAPKNVLKEDEDEIRYQQYLIKHGKPQNAKKNLKQKKQNAKRRKQKYKYKIGDRVRIPFTKGKFDRQYDQKWSSEIFTVCKRYVRSGIPVYHVEDWNNDVLEGSFYTKELQKVTLTEDEVYTVEKIIRKKGNKVFVKWLGWPKKFNTWINASEVKYL